MEPLTVLFAATSAVVVFAIAAVVVGREARRLDAVTPRVVYEIDAAVEFVADALPTDTQARLTPAELEALLRAHLAWMHQQGLQPERPVDQVQHIDTPVVADETILTAHLMGEAEARGVQILDDVDIVRVVEAHLTYFAAIGAVGPVADQV